MDLRKLKTLLELFDNSNLTEMEFSEGEERVRMSRAATAAPMAVAPPPAAAAAAAPAAAVAAPAEAPPEAGTAVKSPMVGTFYRAASPEKPAFVEPGQTVKKGDTLCIIEAMKLMNEIPSPVAGKVVKIAADNGVAVGFGDVLFFIEE